MSQVAQRPGGAYLKPTTVPIASGGADVVGAINQFGARVGAVKAAVDAGASHVGDRYDRAVNTAAGVSRQVLAAATSDRSS